MIPTIVSIEDYKRRKALQAPSSQVSATAPLKPIRETILDLILDHDLSFEEIAVKTGTSRAVVAAVNATYMNMYQRQSMAAKLDAAPCVLRRYKEIEQELWNAFAVRKKAA